MRTPVRTTAVIAGAAVATCLGLATASAGPTATEEGPEPYQLTSSVMTVPVNPLHYPTSRGLCAEGYHVAGDWVHPPGPEVYLPAVHANGDSDIYVFDTQPDECTTNGSDSNGRPYYQGLYVTLGNHSWTQAKQGSFTWTCDPN